jgi:hypothetical protein
LTVCAGYLCGRLQLDQQIHLAESSIRFEQQLPSDWSSGQASFVRADVFVLVLN